jgi:2-polyprenyl-6-methoxyphenol hydroxylase-like FAD-dependent oxidoreductase
MWNNFPACGPTDCDVIIVGAGPAGLVAAITLARQGIDVVVVERHSGTSPFPKATGISVRTMEIFRTWGIEEKIRTGAMSVDPVMTISETLIGGPKVVLPFGYPSDQEALAVSPTTACCCPQDHLEPVLLEQLRHLGGDVRFGVSLVGLQQDDTRVTAAVQDLSGGLARIRARYLIGSDGPRSFVRDAIGIAAPSLGSLGDFVAVTFRAPLAALLDSRPGAINTVQIGGAEGQLVPTGADDRWVYARHRDADEDAEWTHQRCVDVLRLATGVPDLAPQILSVMQFEMGGQVAESFRAGRVFLVGDAAHRTTPVGGTGMNTAIHGAHNLGWKLAWVLRGWAGADLLDSYEVERRPIATANVRRSLRPGPEPEGNGLVGDIGVRYASAVRSSASDAGENDDRAGDVGTTVRVGERAPHVWIERTGIDAARRMSLLDLLEGRLTLLTGRHGGAWAAAATAVARGGTSLDVIRVGQHIHLIDGDLERKYRLGESGAVLIRPDGYVAAR